jgi:hypothetical protein
MDIDLLKQNQNLEFITKVNEKTGVIYPYSEARYMNLLFKVYMPTESNLKGRITLEGSLHKYWNKGKYNFNDFSVQDAKNTIRELELKFKFSAKKSILRQLEIGVNITSVYCIKTILDGCISHFKEPFKSCQTKTKGYFNVVSHQRFLIKIYDKYLQNKDKYKVVRNLLRFEIKFEKMIDLQNMGIKTLSDLIDFGLHNFKEILIKRWDEILFYDEVVFNNHKNKFKYNNKVFWESLNNQLYKYHKRTMNNIINKSDISIKKHVRNLIIDKIENLK